MSRFTRRRWLYAGMSLVAACGRESNHVGWPFPPPDPGPDPDEVFAWAFDRSVFEPMPAPGPGDWLAEHEEPGQDVAQFLAGEPNRPAPPRDTIVIQPIGTGDVFEGMLPGAEEIVDYVGRFFGLNTELRPPITIDAKQLGQRHHQGHLQWNATDINEALRDRLPANAYCCLGVTKVDLFPDPEWNFVFGQANLTERVGVFSLARYDDAFFGLPPTKPELVRRRGLGIVAHEVGHMFGIQHCVHHRCAMNGANNQSEADRCPMHLCALCLRKLHLLVGFDPKDRYVKLAVRGSALGERAPRLCAAAGVKNTIGRS
jgi:archaemetzincin